ncbi:MAG: ABC transporter ATP-binding protein/permease [Christensenellaceae bacterium]|jgi:ATP-binding cassette subfamily B protein|nr:ABC transporter ATP-binding protein/permease [Christensenellaceae bacterium]
MKNLFKYIGRDKKSAILGLASKFTETIFELFLPLVMANLIEKTISKVDFKLILIHGILMLVIIIVNIVLAIFGQYFAAKASTSFGKSLRNALYNHISALSYSGIDNIGASSLITRLTNDTATVQNVVFMTVRVGLRAPFVAIGAIIMVFIIDPVIAPVFVGIMALVVLSVILLSNKSSKIYRFVRRKLDRIVSVTRENVTGVRVVRANSRRNAEIERFSETVDEYKKSSLNAARFTSLLHPISVLVVQTGVLGILIVAGLAQGSSISTATLTAFVTYMMQILFAIIVLTNLASIFIRASASAQRINEVLELPKAINIKNGIDTFNYDHEYAIEFDNVSFGYSAENVLNNISFKIRKGETLGILGGTGSGKTSLVNLIPAFYYPSNGQVKIFDVDTRTANLTQLRNFVSIAPQKAIINSGSIRENVSFGRNLSDDSIITALSIAKADFVDFSEDGLNKQIDRDGHNISGGQKQRLSIARAIAQIPKILILDDAGSALDYATDRAVSTALSINYPDLTKIIVSQRVFAVRQSDVIIMLDNGRIAGIGTHDDLIKMCPSYLEVYLTQVPETEVVYEK